MFVSSHISSRYTAAAYLLVSLVPSQSFRTNYRAASLKLQPTGNRDLTDDAQLILHTILGLLLRLLRPARAYTDILVHGPSKLSAYFGLMTYCMISKAEKLMVSVNFTNSNKKFLPQNSKKRLMKTIFRRYS